MSVGNIVARIPTPAGLVVTFSAVNGLISYLYSTADGQEILDGADPREFEYILKLATPVTEPE